ncbi:MAG: inorganic phosphate transporter [Parasphingorhabdus sp.]|uniref:inorganic phosphate transporter n=1 Tax=Parasphingorhabdus sp. TaxID=2709688 RepID=UPI0030018F6B
MGATFWNLLTWFKGFPFSSSHTLVGSGLARTSHAGFAAVESSGTTKTMVAIFLSPMIGFMIVMVCMLLTSWLSKPVQLRKADYILRRFTSRLHPPIRSAMVRVHKKTMGIIAILLNFTGYLGDQFYVPSLGSCVIFGTPALGIPVSTITDGVVSVGEAKRTSAVLWCLQRVVITWFISIFTSATVTALFFG